MEELEFLSKALQWFGCLAWLELDPMAPTRIITILALKSDKLDALTGKYVLTHPAIILAGAIETKLNKPLKAKHKQKNLTDRFSKVF